MTCKLHHKPVTPSHVLDHAQILPQTSVNVSISTVSHFTHVASSHSYILYTVI